MSLIPITTVFPTDREGTWIEVIAGEVPGGTPDGVFYVLGANGKYYKKILDGLIRGAQIGVKQGGSNLAAKLTNALSLSSVKEIHLDQFNGILNLSGGTVTIPEGKIIYFSNGCQLTNGTVTGGSVFCDLRTQCFSASLTVTGLWNSGISVCWFGAKADTSFGVTGTDNLVPFQKALAAGRGDGFRPRLYIPGDSMSLGLGNYYRFTAMLDINKTVELCGDGKDRTLLLFPPTGVGVKLSATRCYVHDIHIRGTYSQVSSGWNDPNAVGLWVASNGTTVDRVGANCFNGDGVRITGDVNIGTNANENKLSNIDAIGNGRHGVYLAGGDSNQCRLLSFNAVANGRWGVYDRSFLGNWHAGHHTASNTTDHPLNKSIVKIGTKYFKCKRNTAWRAIRNGVRYHALSEHYSGTSSEPGVGASWATYWASDGAGTESNDYPQWELDTYYTAGAVEPEVHANWNRYWEFAGLDTVYYPPNYTTWNNTTTYYGGGGYYFKGNNQNGLAECCYAELDQMVGLNESSTVILGGNLTYLEEGGNWVRSVGVGLGSPKFSGIHDDGTQTFIDGVNKTIGFRNSVGNFDFGSTFYEPNMWIDIGNANGTGGVTHILSNFTHPAIIGRGEPPFSGSIGFFRPPYFNDYNGNYKILGFASGPPAAGNFEAGDTLINSVQSSVIQWRCAASGSPGTWVPVLGQLGPKTVTYGTTINIDASRMGEARITLTGNATIAAPTNPADGQTLLFELIQDGTGSRTVTWTTGGGGFSFSTDVPMPVLSTSPGAIDYVGFKYNAIANRWMTMGFNRGF